MSIFTRAFSIGGIIESQALHIIARGPQGPHGQGHGVLLEAGKVDLYAVLLCRPGPNAGEMACVPTEQGMAE